MAINSGEDDSSIPEDGGRSSSSSAGFLAGQPPLPPGHTEWPTEKSTAGDPADEKVPSLRLLLAACQDQVNLVNEKIKLFEKQKSEEFGLEHYPEYERKLSECERTMAELRPRFDQLHADTRRVEIKVDTLTSRIESLKKRAPKPQEPDPSES
ncbi:hypothetical protein GW17_00049456 [Ensete ventricosum]|nr:hypothetical protein GW17_00049456 [Ensete ventricosum]